MMARPPSITSTALFLSLITVAVATTTITTSTSTISDDQERSIINSKCKYVDVTKINHCKMYLTPDPSGPKNAQIMHLPECCNQLDELETKCRCMGIKEVLWHLKNQKSVSGESLWESDELRQMEQDAQALPANCNVELKEPCVIVQPRPNHSLI